MNLKFLVNLEKNAFYVLLLSVIGIMWWMAVYGLLDDLAQHIKDKHNIPRRVQYVFIIAFVILVILLDPKILHTF